MQEPIETFCPASPQDWRTWLKKHHASRQSVWLILYKKGSAHPSVSWSDTVDQALCFGWIDGKRKPVDEISFKQFFSRRKATGTWSKINKGKVERLLKQGLMTQAGLDCIEAAKKNGSWNLLDDVEELKIPPDLAKAFKAHPGSKDYFSGLSKSAKKMILQWLVLAKRPETRQKRVNETAGLAAQKLKPKPFR